MAVLDDKEIVYVAGMPAKRSLSLTFTIGSRLPAYSTSMGRVLLAALPRARFDEYLATTTLKSSRSILSPTFGSSARSSPGRVA